MTMRRDAIYPSIVVGKPPQEDAWLGKATERIFLPAVRMTVPEIVDYDLPVAGRLPQPRDRLDPQGVPRPRAQGDARALGARDAQPDEGDRRRRRARRRPRLRRRSSSTSARTSTRSATSCIADGPARPPRPRADAAVRRRQDRDRRDRERPGRGRPRVAAGDRDEPPRSAARRPPAGPSTGSRTVPTT